MAVVHSSGYYPAATVLAIAVLSGIWYSTVADRVPDPYLDEVFHVRQAQVYCSGDFRTWDPKITTPPGLYLVSYLGFLALSSFKLLKFSACSIHTLRLTNVGFLYLVGIVAYSILKVVANKREEEEEAPVSTSNSVGNGWHLAHTAINICLFPPLFFFSALYYTDVGSLAFVMLSILCCMLNLRNSTPQLSTAVMQISFGILALLFRQTNIFWVAIFPAALAVLDVLNALWRDQAGQFPDEPVELAKIEDYFLTTLSILYTALKSLQAIVITVIPYMILIVGFVLFVVWNGGVVLGDKSNHVATLHLPQMLYIWPYMLFFSFPIAIPSLLSSLFIGGLSRSKIISALPRFWIVLCLSTFAAIVVHHNTIIHPFTLADNRHYVFYTFRILMKHWSTKYLVSPIYILSGWGIIRTLGGSTMRNSSSNPMKNKKTDTGSSSAKGFPQFLSKGCRASFVIAWLLTTTLSLVTAPLVEPRYFIIPWVVWRLFVPIQRTHAPTLNNPTLKNEYEVWFTWKTMLRPEAWLWMETLWFCLVNCVTGYIFLNWSFEWPQEPGKAQRFMW